MAIQLNPDQEHRVSEALRSGAYRSPDDVIVSTGEAAFPHTPRKTQCAHDTNVKASLPGLPAVAQPSPVIALIVT